MNEEKEKLHIPYGISCEKEIMPGFGKKQIRHFIVGIVITAAISIFMRCLTVGNAFINDTEKFSRLIDDNVECIIPYSKKAVEVINTGAALSHVDDKKYNAALDTIIENILKEEN